MRLISWNVNGLRAVLKKGFLEWMVMEQPDILCLQETKLSDPSQLPHEALHPFDYSTCFNCSTEKKGYSGVCIYTKQEPLRFITEFDSPLLTAEGRVIGAEYKDWILFNVYFPNGKRSPERLSYKLAFYDAFLMMIKHWETKKRVLFCGDVNTAHQEIDLARPHANRHTSGFLPEERAWLDRVVEEGYADTFRRFTQEGGYYTWWDMMTRARDRNVGWRIDYIFMSKAWMPYLKSANILSTVHGSDHCPVDARFS